MRYLPYWGCLLSFVQGLTIQFRFPGPVEGGYYHWTNNYYWVSDSVSVADGDGLNDTLHCARLGCLDSAEDTLWRAKTVSGPGSSTQWGGFGFTGLIPATSADLSFINVARIEGRCEDGSRWYKYLRFPLQPSDISGSMLSADTYSYLVDEYLPALPLGILCNKKGALVSAVWVIPELQMWQFRHGTQRASRAVLVYP